MATNKVRIFTNFNKEKMPQELYEYRFVPFSAKGVRSDLNVLKAVISI